VTSTQYSATLYASHANIFLNFNSRKNKPSSTNKNKRTAKVLCTLSGKQDMCGESLIVIEGNMRECKPQSFHSDAEELMAEELECFEFWNPYLLSQQLQLFRGLTARAVYFVRD